MAQNFSNLYNTRTDMPPHTTAANNLGFGQAPLAATLPTSQIEMTISCKNLLNTDYTSKSDPICLIFMKESWQDEYLEIGRTEQINDNLNPEWVKKCILSYSFETVQKLRFEVYDVDPDGRDFLGRFETTLADIVAYSGRQFVGKLTGISGRDCGQIILVTEEVTACKQSVQFQIAAKDLEKLSWFVSNDPFLVFSRSNEDGTHSVVHKTEVGHSQNYRWRSISIHSRTLCNGDFDRTIKIDCYDNRSNGDHKLIGTSYTTWKQLSKGVGEENRYELKYEAKNKHHCGWLSLVSITITEEKSFLDYIRSGTQMHFAVAIDFTASNGPPQDQRSLHYCINTNTPNPYETALRSVGEIIQPYDSAQLFPAFGFGAKIPPNWEVSHQFPLNGNISHPYCTGINEILHYYKNCVNTVVLYGPTNFSPVINNTISIAQQFQDGKHYFVLLIITDGIISDMHNTKQAIISASQLPISIIIVGVGNADFGAMDELDSDDVKLGVGGRYAERDIVQFVPLNKFIGKNGSLLRSQADLAKQVLAEIPEQMSGYMKSKKFTPNLSGPSAPSAPIA